MAIRSPRCLRRSSASLRLSQSPWSLLSPFPVMWVYLAVVEGTEGEANSGDWERRLVCGWRTDFCGRVRSVCDCEPVLERVVRQALTTQVAREENESDSQKDETRRKRRGAFLLQEGLCALSWFWTCTQPKLWRMVKPRFAISGGVDDAQ